MNKESPLVSVIIPTYNRADLIGETLDSVLAQTYANWECIVVDDGSSDNTEQVVKSYVNKDSRFRYYKRPQDRQKGGNTCRNIGFELSKGEFICWLDSDDLFVKNKIEFQIKKLIHTEYLVSVTQTHKFKDDKNNFFGNWSENIKSEKLTEDLILCKIKWATPAPLWNRKVIPEKPYNEKVQGSQEWLFHILQSIRLVKALFILVTIVLYSFELVMNQ